MTLPETPPPLPPPPPQRQSGCATAAIIVVAIIIGSIVLLPGLCAIIVAASDGKLDWRVLLVILGVIIFAVLVAYEIWRRRTRK